MLYRMLWTQILGGKGGEMVMIQYLSGVTELFSRLSIKFQGEPQCLWLMSC